MDNWATNEAIWKRSEKMLKKTCQVWNGKAWGYKVINQISHQLNKYQLKKEIIILRLKFFFSLFLWSILLGYLLQPTPLSIPKLPDYKLDYKTP